MTRLTHLARLALPAALLLSAAPAISQEGGWTVEAGPGISLRPVFPGADETELRFWPLFDIRRTGSDRGFETPDQSFGISILGNDRFRIGPTAEIQYGRDEEDAIAGIGDIDTTIEGGIFAEAYLSPNVRLRGEVRKGFGGHKGLVGDVGADLIMGDPDNVLLSIGPRVRLANDRYVRAFYGINPDQSELTGLPVYEADGGLHSAGALGFAQYRLSERIGVNAYARYDRLLGDAADSPLVRSAVGSRDQFEAGIGLTYSFDIF